MEEYDTPKMSATFLPGQSDDGFYMPASVDVAAPAPQRAQDPPEKVQSHLARVNLDVRQARVGGDLPSLSDPISTRKPLLKDAQTPDPFPDYIDLAKLPKLEQRPSNVPPSDEEKAEVLESARLPVLSSPDPEVQLAWGQDSLSFIDIHAKNDLRGPPESRSRLRQLKYDALNVVNFLADQKHPKALFMRGFWMEVGKFGQEVNKVEAFRCYKKAAERGYARAEYRMGMQFETTNEHVKALQHYKVGEALGDSASCYRMGMTSLLGQLGQPQDYQRAVQLIRYAADTADADAPQGAYVFGMLRCGELPNIRIPEAYLPLDLASGKQYIERAAFLGFSKAQVRLASAFELCSLDCDFNPLLSLHYSSLAALQGEPEAQMSLSRWFLCGSEPIFSKNESLAYKFARLAAYQEFATAEFALGYFNEVGIAVPPNPEKAKEWYLRAAAKGNKEATDRIDGISMRRTLSRKDHEEVAVPKIRSTHGSLKGERHGRVSRAPGVMPAIDDEGSRPEEVQRAAKSSALRVRNQKATFNIALPAASEFTRTDLTRPLPYPAEPAVWPQTSAQASSFANEGNSTLPNVPIPTTASGDDLTPQKINLHKPLPILHGQHPQHQAPTVHRTSPGPPTRPFKELIDPPIPDYAWSVNSRSRSPASTARTPPATRQFDPSRRAFGLSATLGSNTSITSNDGRALHSISPGLRTESVQPAGLGKSTPPQRGPRTFEEMGVPISKSDHDCTVM